MRHTDNGKPETRALAATKLRYLVLDTENNRRYWSYKIGKLLTTIADGIDCATVHVHNQDTMLRTHDMRNATCNPVIVDGTWKNYRWFENVDDYRARNANEIVRLRHNGWYIDEQQDETTQGIVLRLPNKRGFLAGCSDPYNDGAALVEMCVYDDEDTAARCADQIAERYAEKSRECAEKDRQEFEAQALENERQEMIDNLP